MSDQNINLDLKSQLIIEEYKYCRSIDTKYVETIEKTEVYIIGAVGAAAVFSLAATQEAVAIGSAFASLALACLGFARYIGILQNMILIQDYIIKLDGLYPELGYAAHYRNNNKGNLRKTRYIVWVLLILFGLGLSVFVAINAPLATPSGPVCQPAPTQAKNSN